MGGFHTEYSSFRFALFFLAEFMNTITMSAVMVTLFFGGPDGPGFHFLRWLWPILWFVGKTVRVPVRLRLDPRRPAAAALRPAHGPRLEGPHPALARHGCSSSRPSGSGPIWGVAVFAGCVVAGGGLWQAIRVGRGSPRGARGRRRPDGAGRPAARRPPAGGARAGRRRVMARKPRKKRSLGFFGGFAVTLKQVGEPRVTTPYPDEKVAKPPRLHGRHVLNRYEDGMEKCIGCELCAAVCPADCIYVRGLDNPPDAPVSPGERYGFVYEINYLRCIHCDLCVEACPTEAITESKMFEFSFTNRSDAIYTKTRARRRRRRPPPSAPVGGLAPGRGRAHLGLDAGDVALGRGRVRGRGAVVGRARLRRRARRGRPERRARRRGHGEHLHPDRRAGQDLAALRGQGARHVTNLLAAATIPDAITFAIAAVICVVGAFGVVLARNPVHSALMLVMTLFGVAVLFVEENAQFLAAVQVIVYAGAIVVLFLFVIMLLGVDRSEAIERDPLPGQRLDRGLPRDPRARRGAPARPGPVAARGARSVSGAARQPGQQRPRCSGSRSSRPTCSPSRSPRPCSSSPSSARSCSPAGRAGRLGDGGTPLGERRRARRRDRRPGRRPRAARRERDRRRGADAEPTPMAADAEGAEAAGRRAGAADGGGDRAVSIGASWYLTLAAVLFTIGAIGLLVRRNVLVMFMCVELMLNAANLTFVTFARGLERHRRPDGGLLRARRGGRRGRRRPRDHRVDLPPPPGSDRRRHPRAEGLTAPVLRAAFLIPLLPLAGFVVLLAFGRKLGNPRAGWLATAMVAASFVVTSSSSSACSGCRPTGRSYTQTWFTWISAGHLHVDMGLLVDPLSMTMAAFVTGVSALIHLYSIGYMEHDEDFPKFFLYLNLFVASMLLLVLADNFLFLFLGWEGVGVCSYFLIGFWFERDSAASAGQEGDDLQPHRRRRLPRRAVPHLRAHGQPRVPHRLRPPRASSASPRSSRSGCCCSPAPSASRLRSRSIRGSPTRWRARRRSRRSSTPRRW